MQQIREIYRSGGLYCRYRRVGNETREDTIPANYGPSELGRFVSAAFDYVSASSTWWRGQPAVIRRYPRERGWTYEVVGQPGFIREDDFAALGSAVCAALDRWESEAIARAEAPLPEPGSGILP